MGHLRYRLLGTGRDRRWWFGYLLVCVLGTVGVNLLDSLVGQTNISSFPYIRVVLDSRSRPGDNTNPTLLENMSRHNTHLTSISNNTRTVSTNHPTLTLTLQSIHNPNLIPLGNSLGNSNNQFNFIFNSFDNCVGGSCGWDVDY
jgi:hypothetical protein